MTFESVSKRNGLQKALIFCVCLCQHVWDMQCYEYYLISYSEALKYVCMVSNVFVCRLNKET
jgi:hypothetical protein